MWQPVKVDTGAEGTLLVLCLASQKHVEQGGPDISRLAPYLQQQWDHAVNAHLGNIVITPGSSRKVGWSCNQCPHGYEHKWLARVGNRSNGTGCPQCSGRTVCKHNSLATVAPQAARLWNFAKNNCSPDNVTAYSNRRAHWQCHVCGHNWDAAIMGVVHFNSGCPECNVGGVPEADGSKPRTKHPTFEQCQHPLLSEWDHERNAAEGILPSNTTLRSRKGVHWLCHQCPAGQLHRWVKRPDQRLDKFGNQQRGCPVCAGHVACKCNSLQTHYPAVAAQWDHARNEGSPSDYPTCSGYNAWWRAPARGSWRQTIHFRTANEKMKKRAADAEWR